jgi:hypothetical protein
MDAWINLRKNELMDWWTEWHKLLWPITLFNSVFVIQMFRWSISTFFTLIAILKRELF